MQRRSLFLFIVAALLLLSSATVGPAGAQGGGEAEVRAVDLIGAWVDAGAPNGDFNFVAEDGNTYAANFEADVLPLFTTPGAWFEGSQACTDCHYDNSEDSYHEMDLSSYDGILLGGDVLSKPPGEAIVVAGDWEGSKLRGRLRNNRMPPGWEFDLTEENRDGPTILAGHAGEAAPVTLPQSGGNNDPVVWGLAAAGLLALLAGVALRRRQHLG